MSSPFARRVTGVFASRIARFALGFITSFVLARLLGASGRGLYALAILTPTTLVTLGQLGLPSAMSFFAGRGQPGRALQRIGLLMGLALSLVLLGLTLLALPLLFETVLRTAQDHQLLVVLALVSLPFQFVASFAGAVLIGRQTMRNYNIILVAQSAAVLILVLVLVGFFELGVLGAVIANVCVAAASAVAVSIDLRLSTRNETAPRTVSLRRFAGYGTRVYPASVAGFFNYRADIFMLSAILGDPVPIGLYTLAVSLAELTFFVPDSVSTVFFPRVAGLERRAADQLAPQVSRFTLLVTAIAAIALVPAAFGAVHLLLPEFTDSLPAFVVLLPGILALSISKVLSSYVTGLGMPTPVAIASAVSVAINIVANLLLIAPFGIMGAAVASLISYTAHALMITTVACRLGGHSPLAYLLPTNAEVRRLMVGARELVEAVRKRRPPRPPAVEVER